MQQTKLHKELWKLQSTIMNKSQPSAPILNKVWGITAGLDISARPLTQATVKSVGRVQMGDSRKYPYHTTAGFKDFRRGGGIHDYGILKAWGVFTIWNSKVWGNSTGGISGVESVE